jgi:multisubunit Na+/H+ antiporter MnhB subunit
MAYRAADTLLEKVVVLIAVIAVWSLADGKMWGGRPGPRHQSDPDGPLAFLARRLPPLGIVAGVYIVWMGADLPGGAFPGSTIIAAMWLLAILAGVTDTPPISGRGLRLALTVGPAVFLAVGFAGFFIAEAFLAYPVAYAKPLIVFIEVGMVLTIAASLGLLMSGPPERSGRS